MALDELKMGIEEGNETLIADHISQDGVKIVDNTEFGFGNTFNFTAEALTADPYYIVLFNLIDEKIQSNENTVTLSGELSVVSQGYSGIGRNVSPKKQLITTRKNNSLKPQSTYQKDNFSVEYPDSWYALSENSSDSLMAVANSHQLTFLTDWNKDYFSDANTLDSYEQKLINNLGNIDNVVFNNLDLAAGSGRTFTFDYDITYSPIIAEIKLEKENDKYCITEYTLGQASSTKTISVKETGQFINYNNDLYFVSYGGNTENYNSEQANNILDSFTINTAQ